MKKLLSTFALLLFAAVTTNVFAQEPEYDYYVVGSFNEWEAQAAYKLTLTNTDFNEFSLPSLKLKAGDKMKVIGVSGETTVWYPAGTNNDYVVPENGIFDVYFRPNGNGNNDWYQGLFYLAKTASPFTLSVGESEHGTVKFLVEGEEVTAAYEDDVVTVAITPADNYTVKKVTAKFSVNDPTVATAPNLRDIETEIELEDLSDGYFFEMRAADAKVYVEYESTLNLSALEEALEDANEFYDEIKDDAELANIAGTLLAAINTAQGIYENPQNQDQVDQAVIDLNQALEDAEEAALQLKLKPYTYTTAIGKYSTGFFTDKRTVLSGIEGVKLYVITARNGNTLTTTQVSVVPANTPFLIFNESFTDEFDIVATENPADNVTACDEFQGTAEAMTFSNEVWNAYDIYVCTGTNFYWVMNNGQIGAHKCWIQIAKDDAPVVPSGAPALDIVIGEGTTHIDASLIDSVNDNVIYDLSGRRVANPTTGLYIMNGRKFIVK